MCCEQQHPARSRWGSATERHVTREAENASDEVRRCRAVRRCDPIRDRSYPSAFSTWTRSRVFSVGTRVDTMPGGTAGRQGAHAASDAELAAEHRQHAEGPPRRTSRAPRPRGPQPAPVCRPGGHRCARGLDARQLDLRQHALEGVAADRRFAPGHDEPAGRRAEHGESDLGWRTARFHRHHRTSPRQTSASGAEPTSRSRRM